MPRGPRKTPAAAVTKKKPGRKAKLTAGAGAGDTEDSLVDTQNIVHGEEEEAVQRPPGTPQGSVRGRSPTPPESPAGSTRSHESTARTDDRTDDTTARTDDTRAKRKRADPVTNLPPFRTNEQQEEFIEWWKGQPCLYNKRDAGYRKRTLTDEVRRIKAEELGITVDQMGKYMKHMRDGFNKVSKNVDIHTRSGSGQLDEGEFLSAHDTWLHRVMGWIKVHLQHHHGVSVGVSKPGVLF